MSWIDRTLLLSLNRPFLALGLTAVLTAGLGAAVPSLQKDVRIEKVFPEESPRRAAYEEFVERYGRDDETALCLLEMPRSVLELESMERIHQLTRELTGLERVDDRRLISLSNATLVRVLKDEDGEEVLEPGPLFDANRRATWDTERVDRLLETNPAFAHRLISADRTLAAFLVPLAQGDRSEQTRRAFARDVRAFFAERLQPGETIHLDGFAITYDTVLGLLETDVARFYPLAIVLLLISLGAVFRRALPTLLAVGTVIISVVWTLGSMALLGVPFNFISTTIPVMILVVCVGDAVHLIAHYTQNLKDGLEQRAALEKAIREVGRACFFTSVTTAAGFASLLTSQVELIRELGAPVALGVVFAYVITFLVLPPALAWTKPPQRFGSVSLLAGPLERLSALVARRPLAIAIAFAAILALAGASLPTVSRETRLLNDFDEDQPIMATRIFFEQRMGGVAPLEVLVDTQGRALEPEVQHGLHALSQTLRSEPFRERGVLFALSLPDFLSDAFHVWNGRSEATLHQLPDEQGKLQDLLTVYQFFAGTDPTRDFLDDPNGPDVLRLQLRIKNLYTTEFFALVAAVEAAAKEHLPEGVSVRVTGNTVMSQAIHHTLAQDMAKSFGLAFLLVGGMVLVFFRSPRLALLGMLPNLVPLLLIGGVMALSGIPLSLSTSIVFTIVFGISVDDTIHFVSSYAMHERREGEKDPIAATLRGTGLSLVLSSLVLVLGFSVLLLSQFKANRYFGILVSLTAVFALLADLVLLPALLWLGRKRASAA